MKERGILFSAPMVRALLAGTKTQTRRIAKEVVPTWRHVGESRGSFQFFDANEDAHFVHCRHGEPGDRLWVRETWAVPAALDHLSPSLLHDPPVTWIADGSSDDRRRPRGKTRVSIHMPRWASRITLELASVRVERLQDISETDAEAEGISEFDADANAASVCALAKAMGTTAEDPRASYAALWESINGAGSWDANPWLWAITFRRATP